MAKSNFTESSGSRPADRRQESARTCCPGNRVGVLLVAVFSLGLTAAAACYAWGCAGSAREAASANESRDPTTASLPVSESLTDSLAAVVSAPLEAETVWHTDYQQALALAAEQGRPVLLRFTAGWCMPCQVMERNVFPDQDVKATLAAHAIPVMIDIDEERHADVVRRFGIHGIPTLLLVDADGHELDRGGFMSAAALVEFVRRS